MPGAYTSHYVKSYTVVGCAPPDGGYVLCPECCPLDPGVCERLHGAVFADSEWECSPPTCDQCHEPLEHVSIIHHGDPCEYCGHSEDSEDA